MSNPPEVFTRTATPTQIHQRLELIREQYRMGLIDAQTFNEMLTFFQFPDEAGTLWTLGAQSNQWYRRVGNQWMPSDPPQSLQIPPMPLEIMPDAMPAGQGPKVVRDPLAVRCPNCGRENVGKKFCTNCGTKLP